MTKAELQELTREAVQRALELADGDEEAAFTILGQGARVPLGPSGKVTHHWQVRAVKNQLAHIEKLEQQKKAQGV